MQILDLHPVPYGGPGPTVTVARFNVSVTPDLTLRNMALRRKPDGSYRATAPKAFGESAAFFSPSFAKDITNAAVAAYERLTPIVRFSN